MSAKVGMHTRSMFDGATNPRAMATALMAWFSAPAPTTWTSTAPDWRRTPARAPATEFGFDLLDTLRTSTTAYMFDTYTGGSCLSPPGQGRRCRRAWFRPAPRRA